jgi:hypothetical protein
MMKNTANCQARLDLKMRKKLKFLCDDLANDVDARSPPSYHQLHLPFHSAACRYSIPEAAKDAKKD